jgi:nucleoside-diphosphate-sugar epimerase
MSVRSSYPESKRMCENLCTSYFSEYGVPVKVVRLTQTFGEGVDYNDGRVFAEFARCAIENKDIVLKTKGETKKNYLYVYDAVSAIITVLFNGENGNAYNAANEETYCSIYEMAQMVAEKCGNKSIKVVIEEKDDILKFGYAPTLKMNLSTEKLKNLGWKPKKDLFGMFNVMIDDMIKNKE